MSNANRFRILLIEDNPGDVRLIRETLSDALQSPAPQPAFQLFCADRLSTGLQRLAQGGIDVVLLDLSLPDGHGFETVARCCSHAPDVPIVILTGLDDESLAMEAVKAGAQDYLVKGRINNNLLLRSLRYAVERNRLRAAVQNLSLTDELTGLYNRRGFFTFAENHLQIANRTKRGLALVFADLDGLKQINDAFGHREGDLALKETANILRKSFRSTDIIGRVGGDEFAILMIDANESNIGAPVSRLKQNLDKRNSRMDRKYELSLSSGVALYQTEGPCPLSELMVKADTLMYEDKRRRQPPPEPQV